MKAGVMRHRVRVERFTTADDAMGAAKKTWALVAEVNCQILEAGAGREYFATATELAEGTTRIRLREIPGQRIDPAWRLVDVDTSDVYEIVGVQPTASRNDYLLICKYGGAKR
ncbi:head-tail adaptor protein [Sinorhizobium medicae]|uniref:head-tail adaptor protein n=1 Tax=Sinorhizobium medicae TaxID=110321 RepID=UPI000C7B8162|nr:head-tail adaptor protein [Sinorhizobium medicae]MDX0514886.1 head-tail adaptor protein [Sinorhizobium medicae]MDX0567434.1 head-tail adaptor protein [Sinorhizobium medicae]MDX0580090.1 head-tail adaptor protein [Sinorhizobium medicae]MDX0725725.1 head-tail adaptor protein [Sinorhizobium medicae]MDX0732084.1 head-tail adaptor protein [Sinorhizobium medicae]